MPRPLLGKDNFIILNGQRDGLGNGQPEVGICNSHVHELKLNGNVRNPEVTGGLFMSHETSLACIQNGKEKSSSLERIGLHTERQTLPNACHVTFGQATLDMWLDSCCIFHGVMGNLRVVGEQWE